MSQFFGQVDLVELNLLRNCSLKKEERERECVCVCVCVCVPIGTLHITTCN